MKLRRPQRTEAQVIVFEFIKSYMAAHGYPPTMTEVAEGCGLTSRSTVWHHIHALHRKGYIELGQARYALQMRVVA